MPFGVSFLPGADGGGQQQDPLAGRPSGVPPLQEAIRLLSLRLPRFVGSQGLAPDALMQSQGGGGLADVLRQMFGQGAPKPVSPGGAMPGPAPMGQQGPVKFGVPGLQTPSPQGAPFMPSAPPTPSFKPGIEPGVNPGPQAPLPTLPPNEIKGWNQGGWPF